MTYRYRSALLLGALLVVVVTAGCADGGASETGGTPSPDSLKSNTAAAMQEVSSAEFSMEMDVQSQQGNMTIKSAGAVDLENQRMQRRLEAKTPERSSEVQQYIVGQTVYERQQGEWQSRPLSESSGWSEGNPLSIQSAMIENATVEISGDDTIDGNNVWIVTADPPKKAVKRLFRPTTTGIYENYDVRNVSMRLYVDTETYHVRKFTITMSVSTMPSWSPVELTMTFSEFNQPVDIQLPEAATQ